MKLSEVEITKEQSDEYQEATYEVKTVVPLLIMPRMITYYFDIDEFTEWLRGYEQYAEFIVSVRRYEYQRSHNQF